MIKLNNYGWLKNKVNIIENAIVGRWGMIFNENFELMPCSHFYNFWHNRQLDINQYHEKPQKGICSTEELKINAQSKKIIELPYGKYVFGLTFGNHHNFSHLWDTLQTFYYIKDPNEYTLLHQNLSSKVNCFFEHLKIFGFNKTLPLDTNKFNYKIPHLTIPPLACKPDEIRFTNWIRNKYIDKFGKDKHPKSLYLSRNNQKRQVLNEKEVIGFLSNSLDNLHVVYGNESLSYHVKSFGSAYLIIGSHGSLFKNMVFCTADPRVYEVCPINRPIECFKRHGNIISSDYCLNYIESDEDFNININLDHLNDWIKGT